jgi:hypothetical protein
MKYKISWSAEIQVNADVEADTPAGATQAFYAIIDKIYESIEEESGITRFEENVSAFHYVEDQNGNRIDAYGELENLCNQDEAGKNQAD